MISAQQAWDGIFRDHEDRIRNRQILQTISQYQAALNEQEARSAQLRILDVKRTALVAALNEVVRQYDAGNPLVIDQATIDGVCAAGVRAWEETRDYDKVREAGAAYRIPESPRDPNNLTYAELRSLFDKTERWGRELFTQKAHQVGALTAQVRELQDQLKAAQAHVQELEGTAEGLQSRAGASDVECKRLEEATSQQYALRCALASALAKADPGHPLVGNTELQQRIGQAGVQAFHLAPAGERWKAVRVAGETFSVHDDRAGGRFEDAGSSQPAQG